MAEQSTRDKTQEDILTMVNDWETDSLYNFIAYLLDDLDEEAIVKVAEEQGVDLS